MLKNYFKITIRNLIRQKSYSFINIAGLAIGMACCIFILLWVTNELSYDKFHEKADRIVRITAKFNNPESGYNTHFARCYMNWEQNIPHELPEVEAVTRFYFQKEAVEVNEKRFFEDKFFTADSNIFKVFSFKLKEGDPLRALKEPNSIVLTESMVKKYFGNENPMGRTINTLGESDAAKKVVIVTGILEDIPRNSHFHPDFLASFDSKSEQHNWFYTYILLRNRISINSLEEKIAFLIKNYFPDEWHTYSAPLQKLTDIHLHSDIDREIEPNGNIFMVYIFSIVALFILLIACINFINLSIAGWTRRTREIGIRKVLGVNRRELIMYIFTESLLYNVIGFILAIVLVELLIPVLNLSIGINLSFNIGTKWITILLLGCIVLLSGIISGCYPAFYMSSFQPVSILKMGSKGFIKSRQNSIFSLRKLLIIFQFAISIAVIICAIIINSQLRYIRNKNLGFNKDQTIAIKDISPPILAGYTAFKNELAKYPEVSFVSASMDEPSKQILDYGNFEAEGIAREQRNPRLLNVLPVDENFINAMSLNLLAGRGFSSSNNGKQISAEYILNESAIKVIGFKGPEEAIGKKFRVFLFVPDQYQPKEGTVIGVVKDFHFSNLRKKIEPMVLFVQPVFYHCILIKIHPQNMEKALSAINIEWKKMFPDFPLEYTYLDDLFSALYKSEENMELIIGIFSFMAILIACLGLFGVASFSIVQRTKEIGVRKVLGASIPEILLLLSKDFTKLVVIANIIAWPIAYYFTNKWLQDFAYRIDINLWVFVLSAILAFMIALFTLSMRIIKAARVNPAQSLRYE